ncbi:hypothetical protein DH2020_049991 [Rehmannia glutinosa]|uniref:Uncharacterized protein n=1 Tax=Rehmannia glutinosa TaxID=99300 RepID=A0ABR0U191_REHGL
MAFRVHDSAFTLGYEAGINRSTIDGNLVPPGALVTFIQKGIQYLELEANLNNDEMDADEDFQFLHPLDLITKDVIELQKIIREKKENIQRDKSKGKEKGNIENGREDDHRLAIEKEKEFARPFDDMSDANDIIDIGKEINGRLEENGIDGGPEPMDICTSVASLPCEIPNNGVTVLQGHTSEVFACAWNPAVSLLASGSGDSTARIWTIDGPSNSNVQNELSSVVLRHFRGRTNEKSKDVTTLDWNVEGTLLATGSYDGQARIWNRDVLPLDRNEGISWDLVSTLNRHKGPIFSLKWNKKGDFLLSGSVDKTAIVWDVKTMECKQQFEFHSAPALDVDWRNNVSFATCSTDSMIYVCKVGENRPIKTFAGHQIWTMKHDTCMLDLKEHTKEIYTVRWSPTGPGTNNPNRQLLLASASFDSTIKLWDVDGGRVLHSLDGHSSFQSRDPVYSVAFSPNGEYLASGSLDKCVHIWSVKEAKIVKTFCGNGGIFEVCWNEKGDKIAACFANNVVCVLDFRM